MIFRLHNRSKIHYWTMTRTFHPVGHGAFNTEFFCIKHYENIIDQYGACVFDCGTLAKKEIIDKDIVSNTFHPYKPTIKLLFISHFDGDHTNLFDELRKNYNVERVVIPLISPNDVEILMNLSKEGIETNINYKCINTIYELEKNQKIKVIRIKPSLKNKTSDEKTYDFTNLDNKKEIESGSIIQIDTIDHFWQYIVYNHDYEILSKQFLTKSKKALKVSNITESLTDATFISKNKTKIKNVYEKLKGELNDNSMIVFSLPTIKFNVDKKHYPGCVYMGDYDAKKNFNNELKNLFKKYNDCIGTIQIPHHGSKHNFNKELIENDRFCVISCNKKDKHHPAKEVTKTIEEKKGIIKLVTKDVKSRFSKKYNCFAKSNLP